MVLWRVRATVDDRPGYLSVLTASLALRAVNILAVQVHTTEAGAVDDFLVDAPDAMTERDLLAAVERGRGRDPWVQRAEAQTLVDPPTRALGLASRLAREPEALGEALSSLLAATEVTWRPGDPVRAAFDSSTMRLPDPAGGCFELTRAAPAFTPAEFARAQALIEVATAAIRQAAERVVLVLPDGTELLVRPGSTDDVAAVQQMHGRCSARTRGHRYLSGGRVPSAARLRALLQPRAGVSLLAETPDGRVVAMGTLLVEGAVAVLAVLVEDRWQVRGLGGALTRRLAGVAVRSQLRALLAHGRADNRGWLRTLTRLAPYPSPERDGDLVSVTIPLPVPAPGVRRRTSAAAG